MQEMEYVKKKEKKERHCCTA